MRKAFMEHVRKTQTKLNKRKKKNDKQVGWRESMKHASTTWQKEKEKLARKRKREQSKEEKDNKKIKTSEEK